VTVTNIQKDPAAKTLTVTAEFHAPIERVWQMWADPRQLEKWWGPPTYPATFVEHEMAPGGRIVYFMTGPDGEKHEGTWRVLSVSAPHKLELADAIVDENGKPDDDGPSTMRVTFTEQGTGTRMVVESTFHSTEMMEAHVEMGFAQGLTETLGQLEGLLAV
jgi:uncharacterized protein YndB with AHSA1/START domain